MHLLHEGIYISCALNYLGLIMPSILVWTLQCDRMICPKLGKPLSVLCLLLLLHPPPFSYHFHHPCLPNTFVRSFPPRLFLFLTDFIFVVGVERGFQAAPHVFWHISHTSSELFLSSVLWLHCFHPPDPSTTPRCHRKHYHMTYFLSMNASILVSLLLSLWAWHFINAAKVRTVCSCLLL